MEILIVEDNLELAQTFKTQFELSGFNNIQLCHDGHDAIDCINQKKYDIFVLDIILPEIDGLDILQEIKSPTSINKDSFVIMSTGLSSEKVLAKAQMLGADYYITKPYSFNNLLSAIQISQKIDKELFSKIQTDNKPVLYAEEYLQKAGINEHHKGYFLLKKAFIHLVEDNYDETFRISKDVYPYLANLMNTDTTNVERNIRHAITKSTTENMTNLSFLIKMLKSYYYR